MNDDRRFESVYSQKVRAGKRRTYFFDVRRTKGDDFYLTLTESTKKFNDDGYERHKIFLYKEDFNRFLGGLEDAINFVKTELMPDYDYEEFDRRQEEWEARKAEEYAAENSGDTSKPTSDDASIETSKPASDDGSTETSENASDDGSAETQEVAGDKDKKETTEDDMSW